MESLGWSFNDHYNDSGITYNLGGSASSNGSMPSISTYSQIHGDSHHLRIHNGGHSLSILQLHSQQSDDSNSATFTFSAPLLPGLCMNSDRNDDEQSTISLLCACTNNTVHRIASNKEGSFTDLPEEETENWNKEQHLSPVYASKTPVACHGMDNEETLVIAYSDGTLLKVEWSEQEGRFYETELVKEQSFISSVRSFFPSRRRLAGTPTASPARQSTSKALAISSAASSSSSATEQVIALASDSGHVLPECLFTVSRDRKLRVWSTGTNTCIETVQLPSTSQTMEIVPVNSNNAEILDEQANNISLLPSTVRPLVRFIPPTSNREGASPHLLVYVPTSNVQTSFFILYALSIDDRGNLTAVTPISEKPCDFALDAQSSCQLCDFQYQRETGQLWTLWSEDGQAIVRYSKLNIETSDALVLQSDSENVGIADTSAWYSVLQSHSQANIPLHTPSDAFDSKLEDAYSSYQTALAESDARPSPAESAYQLTTLAKQAAIDTFLTHIFYPGRYPISSISSALYRYVETVSKQSKGAKLTAHTEASLGQQALDVVGAQVEVQQDPQTGALMEREYIKLFKMEWLKFLALAEEGRREAVLPLKLYIAKLESSVFVLAKGGIASTADTDAVAQLQHILVEEDEESIDPSFLPLGNNEAKTAVLRLFSASAILSRGIATEQMLDFQQAAASVSTAPISVTLEDLASDIYESTLESHIDDDLAANLTTALLALQCQSSLAEALTSAFHLLSSPLETSARNDMDEDQTQQQTADARKLALSADLAAQALLARYELSMHLFALVLFVQGEMFNPDPSISIGEDPSNPPISEDELSDLLAIALSTVKTFSIGKWLSEHNTAMTELDLHGQDEGTSGDDLLRKLSTLQMQTGTGSTKDACTCGSILSVLNQSETYKSPVKALSETSNALLSSLGLLSSSHDLDKAHAAMMVATLQSQGRSSDALALIELGPEKEEDAAFLHLRGAIAVERKDMQVAEQCFTKVAAAIHTQDPSIEYLQQVIPAKSTSDLSSYYRYIVTLLDSKDAELSVARFCRLAIKAFDTERQNDEQPGWLKELWNKEFRCYTAIGDFHAAYACMMAMPFNTARQDSLRHLVAVMCDSGSIDVLLQYSFIGLHMELEKTLSFRARNSHPLALPDYYKILFAFHSSRCDYRAAAAKMYQKAKRLATISSENNAVQAVTAQCQSYLAAMNSLSLVSEDQQWILLEAQSGKADAPTRKRQRLLDAAIPDPAVVTLAMIRNDYVLSLARLQLSQHFPELTRANKYLAPADAVALFSQIGAFDTALQTALSLAVDMSSVFEHLAGRCVQLGQSRSSDEAGWLLMDSTASSWDGSLVSKGWRLLELYLARYDDGDEIRPAGRYRKRVLQTVLEEDRRTRLPKFLVNWYMAHHPEHLIWRLVEFDLLEEAYVHARAMVAASASELQRHTEGKRAAVTHLPYNLLDQLLLIDLEDEIASRRSALEAERKELRSLVEQQQSRIEQQWRQL